MRSSFRLDEVIQIKSITNNPLHVSILTLGINRYRMPLPAFWCNVYGNIFFYYLGKNRFGFLKRIFQILRCSWRKMVAIIYIHLQYRKIAITKIFSTCVKKIQYANRVNDTLKFREHSSPQSDMGDVPRQPQDIRYLIYGRRSNRTLLIQYKWPVCELRRYLRFS